MKMKWTLIVFTFLIPLLGVTQDYYSSEYNFGLGEDENDFFEKVAMDGDTIYATVANRCDDLSCTQLVKMNAKGDTIKSITMDDVNLNRREGVQWFGDHLFIADGKGSCCDEIGGFSLLIINRNLQIVEKTFYEVEGMNWCAEASLASFGNYYVIQGWGEPTSDPDEQPPAMIWVNKQSLERDTTITFPMPDPKGKWDQGIVSDGLYYAYFNVSRPTQNSSTDNVRGFYVFNENFEIIDSFLEDSEDTNLVIRGAFSQLKNGDFVFQQTPDLFNLNAKKEIVCVSKEGNIIWRLNEDLNAPYFIREIYDILPTSDGNLILYGWREWLFEFEGDPEVFNEYDRFLCGNIVKVNGETGEIMWERILIDFDEHQNVKETYILDLIELSDNSLMGFGIYEINDSTGDFIISDSWMFRVSENGCIDDDHCSFDSFLSSAKEIENNNKSFSVYPNPVNDMLYVEQIRGINENTIEIFDVTGRRLMEEKMSTQYHSINMGQLQEGAYFICIRNEEGYMVKQIVKANQ